MYILGSVAAVIIVALIMVLVVVLTRSEDGTDEASEPSIITVTQSAGPATTTRALQQTLNGLEALYLSRVQSVTPSLIDNERIDYGYSTCQRLDEGKTLNDAVIALQLNHRVQRQEAAFIAMWSPQHLCTEHKDQVATEMNELAGR